MSQHQYRRETVPAHVGDLTIGSPAPVVIQSMTTTPTLDTESSAAQTASIAAAGAQMVRLTAQGVSHAANLAEIKKVAVERGCNVPLVADIHFNPAAAFEAALHVEKVRINPGNFFDPGRTFRKMEFTDEEYAVELEKIRAKFVPFLALCREHGTALRIGVNHGSLSDRIMSRFGDGPEGMVESALEFLRICRDEKFVNVVVSIKASDVQMMTDTVRLLVERMAAEEMAYPLHLGVTEAGNALDGRIKSAAGIGSLLIDGIGDTIRVSLSERPENEIPVARNLVKYCESVAAACYASGVQRRCRFAGRRRTRQIGNVGANCPVAIWGDSESADLTGVDILEAKGGEGLAKVRADLQQLVVNKDDSPKVVVLSYDDISDRDELILAASVDLGSLLLEGYRDGVGVRSSLLTAEEAADLCRRIVQACGLARYRAEIVACPGCGRTLFDLPDVLEDIKARFGHLAHLKIAVMGCIVNGPGEMAGADYGYVGGAKGKVSLYRGTECIEKNIPQAEAPDMLEKIIRNDGEWVDAK